MDSYFVYVLECRHTWRFVHRADEARDASDAVRQAIEEAAAMGNDPARQYMAVPVSAVETIDLLQRR